MREDSKATMFRRKRIERFLRLVRPPCRILDVGGTFSYWRSLKVLYRAPDVSITIVNLDAEEQVDHNLCIRPGDACDLSQFEDGAFDIVHSNSVIEHVGDWASVCAMAGEVRRLAPAHFVQTPNFYFPIEPHFMLPAVHWLPEDARLRILQWSGKVSPDRERALQWIRSIRLLTPNEMAELFPESVIWEERFVGLTKSLVAIKAT